MLNLPYTTLARSQMFRSYLGMVMNESGYVHKVFVIFLWVSLLGPTTGKIALFVWRPNQTVSALGHA